MKKTHIAALVIIALAIGGIFALQGDFDSYQSFSEASQYPGKEFHVLGTWVKEKDTYYEPEKNPNYFSFYAKDETGEERKVVLHDVEPPNFKRAEKVVMEGSIEGDEFHATKILTKCPSKYVDEEMEVKELNSDNN